VFGLFDFLANAFLITSKSEIENHAEIEKFGSLYMYERRLFKISTTDSLLAMYRGSWRKGMRNFWKDLRNVYDVSEGFDIALVSCHAVGS
jgi:hypothetical protein